jgi:hypothetical protein
MTVRWIQGMSTMIGYIYNEFLKKARDKVIRKKAHKGPEYNRKSDGANPEPIDDNVLLTIAREPGPRKTND